MNDLSWVDMSSVVAPRATAGVLGDIAQERLAQDEKFPDQHLPDGTKENMAAVADAARHLCDSMDEQGRLAWRDILAEEVAEAFASEDWSDLRHELVQVAAVAVRWIEDIDQRGLGLA